MGPKDETPTGVDSSPVSKPKSRQEERFQKRIKEEVDQVLKQMREKFDDAIVTADDPQGAEIVALANQLDAQWRLMCSRKNLIASLWPWMREYTDHTMKDYLQLLMDGEKRHTPPLDAQAPGEAARGQVLRDEDVAAAEGALSDEHTVGPAPTD